MSITLWRQLLQSVERIYEVATFNFLYSRFYIKLKVELDVELLEKRFFVEHTLKRIESFML